jgi:hypothetical protein
LKNKKIYKFGFELNRPKNEVFIVLGILLTIMIALFVQKNQIQSEISKKISAILSVFSWFSILTTPLVEYLRNIYVMIIWTIICFLYLFYKVDEDILTAILPTCVLIYSQISRYLFKGIFGYYPIHLTFNQYAVHRYSEINGRKSSKIDYRYSLIYTITGILLLIICVIIKLKVKG